MARMLALLTADLSLIPTFQPGSKAWFLSSESEVIHEKPPGVSPKQKQIYKDKNRKQNKRIAFSSFSPFTLNRPIVELAAAIRMVERVSQQWGARIPRSEATLNFCGACRQETPKIDKAWHLSIFPTLDIRSLVYSNRSLGLNGTLNFLKGSGKGSKQRSKDH